MNVFAYLALPDNAAVTGCAQLYIAEVHALAHAKEQARRDNKPWRVYKVVCTHYLQPMPVSVEEVKS